MASKFSLTSKAGTPGVPAPPRWEKQSKKESESGRCLVEHINKQTWMPPTRATCAANYATILFQPNMLNVFPENLSVFIASVQVNILYWYMLRKIKKLLQKSKFLTLLNPGFFGACRPAGSKLPAISWDRNMLQFWNLARR